MEQMRLFPDTTGHANDKTKSHISDLQPWGGGPEGETCGNCEHLKAHTWNATHWKCAIWTKGSTVKGGFGGKRRKRDPACVRFTPRSEEVAHDDC